MPIKYPNASILALITQLEKEEERLLFALLRPVPDLAPADRVHWYDGAGRDARPNNLMTEPHIRQWLAIGSDQAMAALFDDVILRKEIDIKGVKLCLTFPEVQAQPAAAAALSTRTEGRTDQWLMANTDFIPVALLE